MPVTVQIPETEAFQEVILPLDYVAGMITLGNYFYVIGGTVPGWIVQIDKSNLSSYTILNFPNDGKHVLPIDLCHSAGIIYVLFRNFDVPPDEPQNFQLTIGKVSIASFAILSDFVDTHGSYLPQAGSISTDDTYLYVTVWQPSDLLRYRLSDANLTVTSLGAFIQPSCIRYSNSKLFLTGQDTPSTQWVMRMSTALAIEQSNIFEMPDGEFLEGQFAVLGNYIWITNRGFNGIVKRILKTDLTNITDIASGQTARGNAINHDGTNVWSLYENGRGARINPSNSEIGIYTVNPTQEFQREITGDGTYIFTAT